jgi:hypothetical protein
VTHLELREKIVFEVMRGGRARWKVENEVNNRGDGKIRPRGVQT